MSVYYRFYKDDRLIYFKTIDLFHKLNSKYLTNLKKKRYETSKGDLSAVIDFCIH